MPEQVVQAIPTLPKAEIVTHELSPVEALHYGALGEREALATTSGVESVSCCHSLVATG